MSNVPYRKILMMLDKTDRKILMMLDKLPFAARIRMMGYLHHPQVLVMLDDAHFEIFVMFHDAHLAVKGNVPQPAIRNRGAGGEDHPGRKRKNNN